MPDPRSLIPRRGNAARPVFFLLLAFFGALLVGFPIFMNVLGLGTAGIGWITLLILAVAVGILWFTVRLARSLDQDENEMDAGEAWAEWTVPVDLHRRFVAAERRGANRRAIAYGVGGITLGLLLPWLGDDRLLGGIFIVVFGIAALVIFFLAGPPRGANRDDARHVRIGRSGVHVLGRYLPFETTMTRLRAVEIAEGDPSVMILTVRAGRRLDQIRVPVPPDQIHQAEAVAVRLRQAHQLQDQIPNPGSTPR